jgi:hypothetical protein
MTELPGGGKPWFVRVQSRASYQIQPCSIEGWLMTAAYVLVAFALTPLMIHPTTTKAVVYGVLLLAITVLFITGMWRMSVPAPKDKGGKK